MALRRIAGEVRGGEDGVGQAARKLEIAVATGLMEPVIASLVTSSQATPSANVAVDPGGLFYLRDGTTAPN